MNEIVEADELSGSVAFMLDQCHNIEPKITAEIRSVMNVQEATAKALLVDREALRAAQAAGQVLEANAALMDASTPTSGHCWPSCGRRWVWTPTRSRPTSGPATPRRSPRAGRRHASGGGVETMAANPPTNRQVSALLARSNRLGSDRRNTNYAGGNASVKSQDPGAEREDEMVAAFDYCLHGKGGAAPSIDTAVHGLVDAAHVDHLHPDVGIALAAAADGEALTKACSATGSSRAGPRPQAPRCAGAGQLLPAAAHPGLPVSRGTPARRRYRQVLALADWLRCWGVTDVVMECTGRLLEGPVYRLEAEGFDCVLADAKQVRHLPGRPKNDRADSRWLAACFERGAITPCFVATAEFRLIRLNTRYRRDLPRSAAGKSSGRRSCWSRRR